MRKGKFSLELTHDEISYLLGRSVSRYGKHCSFTRKIVDKLMRAYEGSLIHSKKEKKEYKHAVGDDIFYKRFPEGRDV